MSSRTIRSTDSWRRNLEVSVLFNVSKETAVLGVVSDTFRSSPTQKQFI